MGKDSALYQLMGVRMNGVMNGIVSDDGEYQQISRKSDEYSGSLTKMPVHGSKSVFPYHSIGLVILQLKIGVITVSK